MLQQPPPHCAERCLHVWVSTEQWPATLCITRERLCFVLFSKSVSRICFLLIQCFLLAVLWESTHRAFRWVFFPILSASACLLVFFRRFWLKTEEGLNKHERKREEMMPLSRCFHRLCVRVCVPTCENTCMFFLICPHTNKGDVMIAHESTAPASRTIFVCLCQSVTTGDETYYGNNLF